MFTPGKKDAARAPAPAAASPPSALPAVQIAANAPATPAPAAASSEPLHSGMARVCATDDDLKFKEVRLPATTIFKDDGALSGKREDPKTWRSGEHSSKSAIITTDPVVLTKAKRCSDVSVKVFVGLLFEERSAAVADNRFFRIIDVVDYPIPAKRPEIEIGKLIDDISVSAILLADATDVVAAPPILGDEAKADLCFAGAQKLAAYMKAAVGRQTSVVVFLGQVPAGETTYGCDYGPKHAPSINVSWDNRAKPSAETADFIGKAGEFLTGVGVAEIRQELAACVAEALKPASEELADRQFMGAKIECQAFARDGGGGSVTVYRRFGASPMRPAPREAELTALQRSSEAFKAKEAAEAEGSVAVAKWWLDPDIPQKVKTFAMTSARILTLPERCPSWKPNYHRIAEAAAWAGVEPSDIQPGGKYFPLMVEMMSAMRAGAAKDSVEVACEAAKKYD